MRFKFLFISFFILFVNVGISFADTTSILREAINAYKANNFDVAKNSLLKVLETEPENTLALYYYGIIYYKERNTSKAIIYLEKALNTSLPPEGIDTLLVSLYMKSKQYKKALPYYEKQYSSRSEDEKLAYQYALCLQEVDRREEAKTIFKKVIKKEGQNSDAARYQLGKLMVKDKDYIAAVNEFKKITLKTAYSEGANAYISALSPHTRLLNLYGSIDYFYDDNPGSTSSETVGFGPSKEKEGSQAHTLLAILKTRNFKISDKWKAKLSYMYYGTFYHQQTAKSNDFVGHYLNPILTYKFRPSITTEMKGIFQFYNYNRQKLSDNTGIKVSNTWALKKGSSIKLHGTYLNYDYTDSYKSGASTISLKYNDGYKYSIGVETTLQPKWGGGINLAYTFHDKHNTNTNNPILGAKARDNRFKEQVLNTDISIPLRGALSSVTIGGSIYYSYKDYLNTQSGTSYPSASEKDITAEMLTLGFNVKIALPKKTGLTLVVGREETSSSSKASELEYSRIKYFVKINGSY